MNHPAMNAASAVNTGLGGLIQPGVLSGAQFPSEGRKFAKHPNPVVFSGRLEVIKVANGYIVNIGRLEGYETESHIASTVEEVNAIITAQLVAFRLEDK